MTALAPHPALILETAAAAEVGAAQAAANAGIEVRELLAAADFSKADELFRKTWGASPTNPPMSVELMRALAHAGSYVAGAYSDDTLVGAGVGVFAPPQRRSLHSHIVGVAPHAQGRNIGYALKLHQRAWSLRNGVTTMTWTYDPLVRRNSYFNIVKLGGRPIEYLPDFYGSMADKINGGDETDRVLISWDLLSVPRGDLQTQDAARHQSTAGIEVVLECGEDGAPIVRPSVNLPVRIRVPADIESLRRGDPQLGAAWRRAVREQLGGQMAAGAIVSGFDRSGYYTVESGKK